MNTSQVDKNPAQNVSTNDANYKILMFYNTTIRNVGLFTSVSVAVLAYHSRLLAQNANLSALFVLISSLAFLGIAIMLNYSLYTTIQGVKRDDPTHAAEIEPWLRISGLVFPIQIVIGLVTVATIAYTLRKLSIKSR